jgi:hypothetical protein
MKTALLAIALTAVPTVAAASTQRYSCQLTANDGVDVRRFAFDGTSSAAETVPNFDVLVEPFDYEGIPRVRLSIRSGLGMQAWTTADFAVGTPRPQLFYGDIAVGAALWCWLAD